MSKNLYPQNNILYYTSNINIQYHLLFFYNNHLNYCFIIKTIYSLKHNIFKIRRQSNKYIYNSY